METVTKRFGELTAGEVYDLAALRESVFVVEQNCPYQELDGRDRDAVHVWLRDEDGIAAYLRVMPAGAESEHVSIGRVLSVRRREGLGTAVLQAGIRAAKECFGAGTVYVEAQDYVRELYLKLGFRPVSGVFPIDGIPHVKMLLELEE